MYEKLIKTLRIYANDGTDEIRNEAADAIEKLSEILDDTKHNYDLALEDLEREWIPATERLPNNEDDVLIYGEWTGVSGTKYREVWLTDLKEFLQNGGARNEHLNPRHGDADRVR